MVSVILMIPAPAPSLWTWLAPVLSLMGTALLFTGSLVVMWRTNAAAADRQMRDLDAARTARSEERSVARANQFRDEVASIVVEQKALEEAQLRAALASRLKQIDLDEPQRGLEFIEARQATLVIFNHVEQLVIRAALFTNELKAIAALADLRVLVHRSKDLLTVQDGVDPVDVVTSGLGDETREAFDHVQAVTRELSTADTAPVRPPANTDH